VSDGGGCSLGVLDLMVGATASVLNCLRLELDDASCNAGDGRTLPVSGMACNRRSLCIESGKPPAGSCSRDSFGLLSVVSRQPFPAWGGRGMLPDSKPWGTAAL
jgi:hypothetical protein